jgi:RNA polymerase sigma-32 factor
MKTELDTALSRYMTEVQKYPRLSREQEAELWRRRHDEQDDHATEALIRANLRYVVAIALKYRCYGLPVADLIAEGNSGIMRALAKFEPERGNRFVTYAAYWIRAFILNYVVRSWSMVGGGSSALRSKLFFKLRRERVRVTNLLGEGDRAVEVLAKRFNTSQAQMVTMLGRIDAHDVSLHTAAFDGGVTTLMDTLASPDVSQEEAFARSQRRHRVHRVVHAALEILDHRERHIVEHRLMADEEDCQSLAEIGRFLGVSRERARQLETRAKRKLTQRFLEMSGSSSLAGLPAETAA